MSGLEPVEPDHTARLRSRVRRALARNPFVYRAMRRVKVIGRYALRRPHEPDFAAVPLLDLRGRLFLDVGANCGQSALSFRLYNRDSPILSIEANPSLEPDLRFVRRILPRFSYLMYAAGAVDGPIELSIPTFRGVQISGEATTVPDDDDAGWWARQHLRDGSEDLMRTRVVTVPCIRLDALDLAPGFIKIDVEGATEQVLDGLWQTISRCRPAILIESDADLEVVTARLAEVGYSPCSWYPSERRFGPLRSDGQNAFFLAEGQPLLRGG